MVCTIFWPLQRTHTRTLACFEVVTIQRQPGTKLSPPGFWVHDGAQQPGDSKRTAATHTRTSNASGMPSGQRYCYLQGTQTEFHSNLSRPLPQSKTAADFPCVCTRGLSRDKNGWRANRQEEGATPLPLAGPRGPVQHLTCTGC